MLRAVALLALLLAGCDDIHHMLATHPRPHRVHARPQPAAPVVTAPAIEDHDALVARKRDEADRRKRDWCDAHRDLTVRNGCDLRR